MAIVLTEEEREGAQSLLVAAQSLQVSYWDALHDLEAALGGIEIDGTADLQGLELDEIVDIYGDEDDDDESEAEDLGHEEGGR